MSAREVVAWHSRKRIAQLGPELGTAQHLLREHEARG